MIHFSLVPASVAAFILCTLLLGAASSAAAKASVHLPSEQVSARRARMLLALAALPPMIAACFVFHALGGSLSDMGVCRCVHHVCLDRLSANSLGSAAFLLGEVLALGAAGWAGMRLARALRASGRVGKRLVLLGVPLSPRLSAAVRSVAPKFGMPPARFKEVSLHDPVSLTCGFLRPTCVFSSALVSGLSAAELEAVVAHEAAHVKRRDNLARILVAAWDALAFLVPPLRHLSDQWKQQAEMAADELAASKTGRPIELASALVRVGRMRQVGRDAALASSFAVAEWGLLTRRVKRLLAAAGAGNDQKIHAAMHLGLAEVLSAATVVAVASSWLLCGQISPSLRCVIENLVRVFI